MRAPFSSAQCSSIVYLFGCHSCNTWCVGITSHVFKHSWTWGSRNGNTIKLIVVPPRCNRNRNVWITTQLRISRQLNNYLRCNPVILITCLWYSFRKVFGRYFLYNYVYFDFFFYLWAVYYSILKSISTLYGSNILHMFFIHSINDEDRQIITKFSINNHKIWRLPY